MHKAIEVLPTVILLTCASGCATSSKPLPGANSASSTSKDRAVEKAGAPANEAEDSAAKTPRAAAEMAEADLSAGRFARAEALATRGLELLANAPSKSAGNARTAQNAGSEPRLLHVRGVTRAVRGDYTGAEEALVRASELASKVPGATQADSAFALLLLGRTQLLACKLEAARKSLERAASIDQPLLPATEVDFGLAQGALGEVEEESGHSDLAAKRFERAAQVLGSSEGREPWALVGYLTRLAALQKAAGKVDDAARTLERAIAISARFPGRPSEPGLDAVSMYQELARSGTGRFLASQKLVRWRGGAMDSATLASASDNRAPAAASDTSAGARPRAGAQGLRWDAVQCGAGESGKGQRTFSDSSDQVVASLRQSFRACYNAELKTTSDAGGSIRYVAKIGPTGSVLAVRATSMGLSPDVAECAGEHVLHAQFGPPDGGSASVVIPVTFEVDHGFRLPRLPF